MTRLAWAVACAAVALLAWLLFAVAVADAPGNPSTALVAMAAAWICRPATAAAIERWQRLTAVARPSEPLPKE